MSVGLDSTLALAELREMTADIEQTITLASGKEIAACVTTGGEADEMEIGGVTEVRRITVVIAAVDCDELPVANDVIIYNGKGYRITEPTTSDDGVSINLAGVGEFE